MAIHRPGRLIEDWHEIEDAGIPLEPVKFRVGTRLNNGFTIRQIPMPYNQAQIRELNSGRVAYVMPVFIRRDAPGKSIVREWTLHVPWDESVEWLEEDKRRNRGWYAFSKEYPPKHEYSLDMVLNHRMLCSLSRGDIREGFLLAEGRNRPPETYHDGEIIPIRFCILDQWDCEASVTFKLPLVRDRHRAKEIPRSKREPLFSRPDRIAPVEKGEAADPTNSVKKEKQVHIKK